MNQGDIILNLTYLLHQQSLLFLNQIQEQNREFQEFIITNFSLIPPDSDIEQSHQQEDERDLIKVEEQQNLQSHHSEYILTEREQFQFKQQLTSYKRLGKNDNIIIDIPEQIGGVYVIKDKLRIPIYLPKEVSKEKQGIIKTKNKSITKQVKFKKNLLQSEDIENKGQLDNVSKVGSPFVIKTNEKCQEKQELFSREDKQNQQTQKNRKFKSGEQLNNQSKEIRKDRFKKKMVKNQICSHCDKKFFKLDKLLKHEARDHGIIRQREELFGNDILIEVNQKKEQGQSEKLQLQGDMEKSQFEL